MWKRDDVEGAAKRVLGNVEQAPDADDRLSAAGEQHEGEGEARQTADKARRAVGKKAERIGKA